MIFDSSARIARTLIFVRNVSPMFGISIRRAVLWSARYDVLTRAQSEPEPEPLLLNATEVFQAQLVVRRIPDMCVCTGSEVQKLGMSHI